MNRYKLTKAGVDVNQGLKRLDNNKEFYEELLVKFCEDTHFEKMVCAMNEEEVQEAFQCAHAVKGAAGNLSMTRLYTELVPLVDALRKNDLQHARQLLPAVQEAYTAAVNAII